MRKENVGENNTKTVSNTISYQKPTSINATHGDDAELVSHDVFLHASLTVTLCATHPAPGRLRLSPSLSLASVRVGRCIRSQRAVYQQ